MIPTSFNLNDQVLGAIGVHSGDGSYAWASVALTLVEGIGVIALTMLAARFARHLSRSASQRALWDVQLVLLVGRLVYIAVLVLGFLTFLFVVFPRLLTPVVGFVGLLGLAFGLAFQDILKNWISGFFLLLERPFRIGDEITVGAYTGSVETVLLRVTVLRTLDARRVLVPNQQVYTSAIVDASSYPSRQFSTAARLAPERELAGALKDAAEALRGIEGVAEKPPAEVSLVPDIEHGATLEVRYWVNTEQHRARPVQRRVNAALTGVAAGQKVVLPESRPGT